MNSEDIDAREIEKSKGFTLVNVTSYVPHAVDSKTVVKKPTGNISVVAVDTDAGYDRKISPYDTFVQIIDGRAEFMIDGKSNVLETGEAIVIPAHSTHAIKANERFKMISIIIKSGYE